MFRVLSVCAILIIALASIATASPQVFLSWDASCPTVVQNKNWSGPANYSMYVALKNLTAADKNVGTEVTLAYGPPVADAWRFDDVGCQYASQVLMTITPNSPGCPAMTSTNSLTLGVFVYDSASQTMHLRLENTYDAFTPSPGVTYTLWNLTFNHAISISGHDNNPSTCDNAATPMCIYMPNPADPNTPSWLWTPAGGTEPFTFAQASDGMLSWNAGCQPVPTLASTWGRIRAMYR